MNKVIEDLESTTFGGHRFTKRRLEEIQTTVSRFPNLSRAELANTICEHLQWLTAKGRYRNKLCLNTLAELEKAGIIQLPAKDSNKTRGPQKKILHTDASNEQTSLCCSLDNVMPISLQIVTGEEETKQWKEFIDRYHYLGYKHPIGQSLRVKIISVNGALLACLQFSYASQSRPCRDQWIGWDKDMRKKRLHLVLNNTRFLILPWIDIPNLASKVLSLSTRQLADNWERHHGYRPVLLETFVDTEKFKASSYRAANWQEIGKTAGRNASTTVESKSQKSVYVYPLVRDFKAALLLGKKTCSSTEELRPSSNLSTDDPFVQLWGKIIGTVVTVADNFDQHWQKRRRVITTLLLVLFIFRLVFSKNTQGYGTTIAELWDQCRTLNIPLPQGKPLAPSAFCQARKKMDENIFKRLNTKIIEVYRTQNEDDDWKGHRLFAVDGSKLNLPRTLSGDKFGYSTPTENAYYPQGLLSCLYRLKPKIPIDFDLVSHGNERRLALTHLRSLKENDIVVYDRGYFSYAMLYFHSKKEIQAIFRLKINSHKAIDQFITDDETDKIITINPTSSTRRDIRKKHPEINIAPLKLRLIRYVAGGTTYILGTTLLNQTSYKAKEFSDIYHARWGVEELYKISKKIVEVDDFHGKCERGVKQELFAHFVLITLTRIFSNHAETKFNKEKPTEEKHKIRANFKNSLVTVARNIEALFLHHVDIV